MSVVRPLRQKPAPWNCDPKVLQAKAERLVLVNELKSEIDVTAKAVVLARLRAKEDEITQLKGNLKLGFRQQ
jgi:hypothetical protein